MNILEIMMGKYNGALGYLLAIPEALGSAAESLWGFAVNSISKLRGSYTYLDRNQPEKLDSEPKEVQSELPEVTVTATVDDTRKNNLQCAQQEVGALKCEMGTRVGEAIGNSREAKEQAELLTISDQTEFTHDFGRMKKKKSKFQRGVQHVLKAVQRLTNR